MAGKRKEKSNEKSETQPKTNKRGDRRGMSKASIENLKPIQPGEVRNPKGWPKGKRHADTLFDMAIERFAEAILETVNKKRKVKKQKALSLEDSGIDPELDMWMKQMEKARNGDTKAFELIMSYRLGKPTQNVNLGGQVDNPILVESEAEEVEAEVEEWIDGWFNPVKHKKVTVKKKNANSKSDKGTEE